MTRGAASTDPWASIVETHTAGLFFAGDFVLKVKKPVALAFVDLSTRRRRRAACEAELRLNRRLAPDVYLGVADIVLDRRRVESAVVMRRLPSDAALDVRILAEDPELPLHVTRVAEEIARFHRGCTVVGGQLPLSRWTPPIQLWLGDIEQMRDLEIAGAVQSQLDLAAERADSYADRREALFQLRLQHGLVRDGHGDLLASDVFILGDGPRILDCLEFDDRLRTCDVLHDVAFLAMDLERLGRPELATLLLTSYSVAAGERHPPSLAHFFIAHRALVRAKVAAVRRTQPGVGESGEHPARLMQLCLHHLEAAQVRIVLLGGLPGAGKSTLASLLADATGALHLSSDRIRAEIVPDDGQPAAFGEGRYSRAATAEVYSELLRRARAAVERGEHVVLDASWASAESRDAARAVARELHAVPVEILACTDDATAAERMVARRPAAGGSEADFEVRRAMRPLFHEWQQATRVDTSGPVERSAEAVEALFRALPDN